MRYVLQNDTAFIKRIQWTELGIPFIHTADFNKAMIVDDDYLDYLIGGREKTRRELIQEYYPDVEFKKVMISLESE